MYHKSGISRRCLSRTDSFMSGAVSGAAVRVLPPSSQRCSSPRATPDHGQSAVQQSACHPQSSRRYSPRATHTSIPLSIVFCVFTDLSCLLASIAEGARVLRRARVQHTGLMFPRGSLDSDQETHPCYPLRIHSTSVRRVRDPQCGAHHAHYVTRTTVRLPVAALARACIVPV